MGHEEKVLDVLRGSLERAKVLVVRTEPHEDFHVAIHFLRVTGRLVVADVQENLNRYVPVGRKIFLVFMHNRPDSSLTSPVSAKTMTSPASWMELTDARDIVGHIDLVFCEESWTDTAGANPVAIKTLVGFLLNEATFTNGETVSALGCPNSRRAHGGHGDQPVGGIMESLSHLLG
eukprot:jgi/Botrbrau1/20899/Bobra.0135s0030.1